MNLTRRGIAVVSIAVLAFVLGAVFGARALDVVVVPALAMLVVAIAQIRLTDRPVVERSVPEPGFPGEHRSLQVHLDTESIVSVTDQLGSGLRPETVERTVAGGTITFDVELARRGAHDLGPLTVAVRDSLGLLTTEYRYSGFDPLIVYPPVKQLTSPGPLSGLVETTGNIERQAFDQLREYVSGDSLRDIHWKKSAKHRDDLFVVEYSHGNEDGVSIAAEATADRWGKSVDAMATATASIVAYLLDHGVEVSLAVPNGSIDLGSNGYRREVFDLLARTTPGRVSMEHVESADVYVLGERGDAMIEIDGRQFPFDQLLNTREVVA